MRTTAVDTSSCPSTLENRSENLTMETCASSSRTSGTPAPGRRRRVSLALVTLAGVGALALAGCGGSSSSAAPAASSTAPAEGSGQAGGQHAQMPGASGLIASWSGGVMQVQGTSAQTAVTVSSSTRITEQKPSTEEAVVVGSCVTVRPATTSASGGTPSASASSSGPIAAGTVQVRAAVNGSCSGGFGGGSGTPSGSFTPRARPSGAPTGAAGGFRDFGASGTVTSVSANGFVVQETRGGTTTSATVTTSGTTTYTTTATATSAAIKVGECATAIGTADSTGSVAARSLSLSQAVNGQCTSGFGRFGGRNG